MMRVLWRQHRLEGLSAIVVFILVAAALLVTGLGVASSYHQTGMAACIARQVGCSDSAYYYFNQYVQSAAYPATFVLLFVPVLAGVFVGAPLVASELEQGTYRLAWTQSLNRSRWLLLKLLVLMAGIGLFFALVSLLMAWWRGPVNPALGPWEPFWGYGFGSFDVQGIVPIAYGWFAFALGVAVGVLVRRTLPAMALALLLFVLLRVLIAVYLRPYYLPPLTTTWPLDPKQPPSVVQTGWVVVPLQSVDRRGQPLFVGEYIFQICPPHLDPDGIVVLDLQCEQEHGWFTQATYQPADRFWLFQGIESALYLALTGGLLILTRWWVRKRIR